MGWVAEEKAIKIPYKPEGGYIRFYYGPVPVGMTESEGLGVIEYKPGEDVEAGAEVFMAETGPEDVIEPHFHRVNQFQIVVHGSGSIGKEPVQPAALFYTDGYTPYGPIVAGPEGLAFFTIRAKGEPNVYYMPQSRKELVRKAGRAIIREIDVAVAGEGALNQEVAREPLIEPQEDGLAAFLIRARPGAEVAGAVARDTAGQCHLLLGGSAIQESTELGPLSCLFVSPGDTAPQVFAGAQGCQILVLQFPKT